ncbi:MAG: RNA polymerase sigma factor [Clostridia bacterium]|nr:RNA polymerase sigma factor [Clostridia bacterium]
MDDKTIVALYWERSEAAIEYSQQQYGNYCYRIADNVLHNREDNEECVNDTWVRAWNAMPPERPTLLGAFLGKITRNLALDRYNYDRAKKRGAEIEDIAEEFWQCVPNGEPSLEDQTALHQAFNGFLATLSEQTRKVFMQRYWYLCPIEQIARETNLSPANVKVKLHRTRKAFKDYLQKEGIDI